MRYLVFVALLACQAHAQAQDVAVVQGTVRDATGLMLPGAAVEVDERLVAVSDAQGHCDITLPTPRGCGRPRAAAGVPCVGVTC